MIIGPTVNPPDAFLKGTTIKTNYTVYVYSMYKKTVVSARHEWTPHQTEQRQGKRARSLLQRSSGDRRSMWSDDAKTQGFALSAGHHAPKTADS